jgi:hypothetical protein
LAQLLIEDSQQDDPKPPLIAQTSVTSTNAETKDLTECTSLLLKGRVDVSV